MEILLNLLGLAAGIAVLVWSADIFVDGSAAFAKRCGMSSLLIGMLIIGFGTSMPELLVSVLSALEGSPSIALGNAYGSNTANIGLILGLTALIAPVAVTRDVLKRQLPALISVVFVCGVLLINGTLSRFDAIIMLVFFVGFLIFSIKNNATAKIEENDNVCKMMSLRKSLLLIFVGLALLIGSSRLLVICAIKIATILGVPDLIIGLTIVAIGTSLPELASSLAAIKKQEHDLAIGNVIGSNFFNTLAVVGLACVISPMTDDAARKTVHSILVRDYPVMTAITVMLLLCCIPFNREGKAIITRYEGAILLASFLAYVIWLIVAP